MPGKLNKWDKQHLKDIERYARKMDKIYQEAVREATAIGASVPDFNPDKPFSFASYTNTKARIEKLLSSLENNMATVIVNGIRSEWTLANNKNNALCDLIFGDKKSKLTKAQERKYYSNNSKALEEFVQRKSAGMNLSDRVWNYTNQFKFEIEMEIDLGLRVGLPAAEMARELKQYLKYPDKLFRRVRDEHEKLHLSQNAKAYNPGQGVYRSSYKNAMRLARTETNMAYRTSDHTRWQQLDFVVGIEVRLSNNHTLNGRAFTDICDKLKGKYPKDFKFTGWHPACRCHAVSILKTEEEFEADNERIMNGDEPLADSVNTVKDVPENFTKWVTDNEDRVSISGYKGTTPYFLLDNDKYVNLDNFKATKLQKFTIDSSREYLRHDVRQWQRDYFNRDNGGYLAVDKQRIERGRLNKDEQEKYNKEYDMCLTLAQNGYKVEYLKEVEGKYDINLNGESADLKKTKSHNHIIDYAKKAIYRQDAKMVIFEFENETTKIHEKLRQLKSMGIKGKYYFSNDKSNVYDI
jgi:hypothetical protein